MARLRTGFTTGAYAAATALAAWRRVCGRRNGRRISLCFPDGRLRRINVDGWERVAGGAEAWATKDAGDDIDCTDGAVVRSRLTRCEAADVRGADHVVDCGGATLVLRAGRGVGRVTREGLEVAPGKWAINAVPRQMVADNLRRAGLSEQGGHWLVEIGIDGGEALARKTLNPTLGVEGGLSVLGSSGIVVPSSNAAYISTIEILLRGARKLGCGTAVLVTGGRTHAAARELFPELPEVAFVRIGDFIREACGYVDAFGFERLVVCCMPGKLAKYALGHAYTHAHRVALDTDEVAALLAKGGIEPAAVATCRDARTMREGLLAMDEAARSASVGVLAAQAGMELSTWAPGCAVELHVLSFDGLDWWE